MKFTVTEEFIREAHGAACSNWKQRIEKEFPDLFKTKLEVGKWYVLKTYLSDWLMNYQGNGSVSYGFNTTKDWGNNYIMQECDDWKEATHEEVESALIAEAKKRGYKKGVRIKGLDNGEICTLPNGGFEYMENENVLWFGNPYDDYDGFEIFNDGKWAQILPEEKTIITKGKALRIIAKKLKVSPESIEIQ